MLLIRTTDTQDGTTLLLPPGGGVEFGEKLDDAVKREILEELGLSLPAAKRVGMLEAFFQFDGRMEHELVYVYEADCNDEILATSEQVTVTESNGQILHAHWYRPRDIAESETQVFPDGLLELLNAAGRE